MIFLNNRSKPGFISQIAIYLHYLAILGLLISLIASYVHPEKLWFISLIGIAFPVLYIINVLFLLFWLFNGRSHMFHSLIILVLGFQTLNTYVHFGRNQSSENNNEQSLKVVSFNVHNFSRLKSGVFDKSAQKECFQFLENQQADIICLQEFSYAGSNIYASNIQLKHRLGAETYYYESYYNPLKNKLFGLVTYSKFPIVNTGYFEEEGSRKFGIFTDLLIEEDTVRVYNIHLESTRLTEEEYSLLSQLDSTFKKRSVKVLRKMKRTMNIRAKQADMIADNMSQTDHEIIVCGDFNEAPNTYVYKKIKNDLTDSFELADKGLGKTFQSILPFFRIDYIFSSEKFEALKYEEFPINLSDHYPIKASFKYLP